MSLKLFAVAAALVAGASWSAGAQAATCIGNCGHSGPDGVVAVAPTGDGTYDWVSTALGQSGAAQITGFSDSATNGSELRSDPFFAAAGQSVSFWFNYVTSDGAGYADYGFAQLIDTGSGATTNLFTARTQPSGTIVPGVGLPAVEANLSPATVPINPGGPVFSPLGESSGGCYASGCGFTGWIQSTFEVVTASTYELRFGVANWLDTALDTAMAFSGLVVNGTTIGDGGSPDNPLAPTGEVGPNGGFEFTFTPTPAVPVFIDPDYASGYTYKIVEGANAITSAIFPSLSFDTDGYDVYSLEGLLLASGTMTYDFGALGVQGFKLMDIDYTSTAGVDPTDPMGFVTGLVFLNGNEVSVTQTPTIVNVPSGVPEPSAWLMMITGFGLIGVTLRSRGSRLRSIATR